MTVAQLIEQLNKLNPDKKVVIKDKKNRLLSINTIEEKGCVVIDPWMHSETGERGIHTAWVENDS